MNNNPLAKTIRNAFIINVANKKTSEDASYSTNTIGNILRHKRITIFEKAINRFFISSGLPPVKKLSQFVDEKNLLTFSLQLSGYIRDSQKELANLRNEDATDPNLIKSKIVNTYLKNIVITVFIKYILPINYQMPNLSIMVLLLILNDVT